MRVMDHQSICQSHDRRRTSIVSWELQFYGLIVGSKLLYLFVASSIPLVDDLVVISNREKIFEAAPCEVMDESVLSISRILKFIEQPISICLAVSVVRLFGTPERVS